jgi:hypothetical protein
MKLKSEIQEIGGLIQHATELVEIDNRIDNFIDGYIPEIKYKIKNKKIEDFPELGFYDFTDFQEQCINKKIEIYGLPVRGDYNRKALTLIGRRKEINSYGRNRVIWPQLLTALFVIAAIFSSNYWLLFGLLFLPISLFTSGKNNIFGMFLVLISFLTLIYFLIQGEFILTILPLGFLLIYSCLYKSKADYRKVLVKRALESEQAFIFLLFTNYITLWRKANGEPQRIMIKNNMH